MVLIQLIGLLLILVVSCMAGAFYNVNGTNYYISYPTLKKNWHQAQRYCILHGMHAATIHTESQYNAILEILEKHQITAKDIHFWTSGTDLGASNREYYWAASGLPLIFTNWLGGSPRNGIPTKLCILLNGDTPIRFQFYDYSCDTEQYVMCQSHLELPEMLRDKYCHASD